MLKVTVELLPFGQESGRKTLLEVDIGNIGPAGFDKYNYSYNISGDPWRGVDPYTSGHVFGYDRNKPLVNLLSEVFTSAVEPEVSPDQLDMLNFAKTLHSRYEKHARAGKEGWEGCDIEYLWELLDKNAQELDPVDVGVLAWMIYERTT